MNSIKEEKSNYSVFLLGLLFVEFISFFFRANALPNLGIWVRVGIFAYIIVNFLLVVLFQFSNGLKLPKLLSSAIAFWLYSLVVYFLKNELDVIDIINLTSWVVVLYLFYYYGFPKSMKRLITISSAFVLVFLLLYYRYSINGGYMGDKPGVVNAIYFLVFSVPFITLINNRFLKNALLVLVSITVLLSMKGTAIIIIFVTLFINYLFIKKNANRKNVLLIFGGFFAFIFISVIISEVSSIKLFDILNDDIASGGNGRFKIWENILKEFFKGGFFQKIFGFGFNYSAEVISYSAHCDFIEILISFGIVGFSLFLRWVYYFVKEICVNGKTESYFPSICFMVLAQIILIMMFSTTIFVSNYFLIAMAILGMILNEMSREKIAVNVSYRRFYK